MRVAPAEVQRKGGPGASRESQHPPEHHDTECLSSCRGQAWGKMCVDRQEMALSLGTVHSGGPFHLVRSQLLPPSSMGLRPKGEIWGCIHGLGFPGPHSSSVEL